MMVSNNLVGGFSMFFAYPSEKPWSSTIGMMTFHSQYMENVLNMFQTTNQIGPVDFNPPTR